MSVPSRTRLEVAAIFARTTPLRGSLQTELSAMRSHYNNLLSAADTFDSATNAELRIALETNLRKKEAAVALLDKLLSFMRNSTLQIVSVDNSNCTNLDAMR